MYSVDSLERTICDLFRTGIVEADYIEEAVEAMLEHLDFDDLLQAVRHHAVNVHAYETHSIEKGAFTYRGADLFQQRATLLLQDHTGAFQVGSTMVTRTYELWLLEDMTVTATVCLAQEFMGGVYSSEYREIKGDPWDCGMYMDLEALTLRLKDLCDFCEKAHVPFYEL